MCVSSKSIGLIKLPICIFHHRFSQVAKSAPNALHSTQQRIFCVILIYMHQLGNRFTPFGNAECGMHKSDLDHPIGRDCGTTRPGKNERRMSEVIFLNQPIQLAQRINHRYPQPISFLINTAQLLGGSLLFFDIDQPGDHNALGLGRSGAVHGFGKVTDSGRSQGHILDQS